MKDKREMNSFQSDTQKPRKIVVDDKERTRKTTK